MIARKSQVFMIALGASSAAGTQTCSWSVGTSTDIYGTGMDQGTKQWGLQQCQNHCQQTSGCQSAQFSQTQEYNGKNCFIYNSQNDNNAVEPAINQFLMYKCTHNAEPHCSGNWCGPYLRDIYGTGIDGGSSQWSLDGCKTHCIQNQQCRTAQYSDDQNYNGNNCFIYDNSNPNQPQLKNFKLWYYKGHDATWGEPQRTDISGVGLGGSWESNLAGCKARCAATGTCKAAQYSSTETFEGFNCFIYASDTPNAGQFKNFLFYTYDRDGCTGWLCSRRLFAQTTEDDKWTLVSQDTVNV